MPAETTAPAPLPPQALALPFTAKDARREQLQKDLEEATSRLKRVRQYRFALYGEIRRCLSVLGDSAGELVGEERFEELKRDADRLAPDPVPLEGPDPEEMGSDPALAWMEPDPPGEALESARSLPPPPSSEETGRAARTLRECLEYLEAAERYTPEFHLAILDAEERLRAYDEANPPAGAADSRGPGAPVTAGSSTQPSPADPPGT